MKRNALKNVSWRFRTGYAEAKSSINACYTQGGREKATEYANKLRKWCKGCRDKKYANGALRYIAEQGF